MVALPGARDIQTAKECRVFPAYPAADRTGSGYADRCAVFPLVEFLDFMAVYDISDPDDRLPIIRPSDRNGDGGSQLPIRNNRFFGLWVSACSGRIVVPVPVAVTERGSSGAATFKSDRCFELTVGFFLRSKF